MLPAVVSKEVPDLAVRESRTTGNLGQLATNASLLASLAQKLTNIASLSPSLAYRSHPDERVLAAL